MRACLPKAFRTKSNGLMDPLDMIQVCRKCYDEQRQHGTRDNAERLRNHGGCSCNPRLHQSNGQRNSFVYTVIDVNSGKTSIILQPRQRLGPH